MYGWSQILIGIAAILFGLFQVFDASATRIWIGAFVLGPMLIYRGIVALQEDDAARGRASDAAATSEGPPPDREFRSDDGATNREPEDVQILAARKDSLQVAVTCEKCNQPYVYFPEASTVALTEYHQTRQCAAPCPRCGWIQPGMFDLMGAFSGISHWTEKLFFAAFLLLLGSAGLLAYNFNKFYGAHAPDDPNERYYWYADLSLLIAGVGCAALYIYGLYRPLDLNDAPLERRLARGKLLGLPAEEVAALQRAMATESTAVQVLTPKSPPGELEIP